MGFTMLKKLKEVTPATWVKASVVVGLFLLAVCIMHPIFWVGLPILGLVLVLLEVCEALHGPTKYDLSDLFEDEVKDELSSGS